MNEHDEWQRRRVYDPVLRSIHGWNALVLVALLASGWSAELVEHGPAEAVIWNLHIVAGYGLVIGLVARLAWGLVGPRHARLADLWHPRCWLAALKQRRIPRSHRFGHNEYASLAYLAVYALLVTMGATGLALAAVGHGVGPLAGPLGDLVTLEELFKEPHEAIATLLALFVGAHLAALVIHERLEGNRIAASMVTGVQFRRPRESSRG